MEKPDDPAAVKSPATPALNTARGVTSASRSIPSSDESGTSSIIVHSPSNSRRDDIDRRHKATVIRFSVLATRPEVARVQLVLCNISDRNLQFTIKCAMGSNVSAFPSGSGDIEPHGQSRLTLSWLRLPECPSWQDSPKPKMLLNIKFQERKGETDTAPTQIRLLGKINPDKFCKSHRPPEEQLLLDADKEDGIVEKKTLESAVTPSPSTTSLGSNLSSQELLLFFALLYLLVFLINSLTKFDRGK